MKNGTRRTFVNAGTRGQGRIMRMTGLARPTARQQRLTEPVPEGKVRCPECGKCVTPYEYEGTLIYRGHQAVQYVSCRMSRTPVQTTTDQEI